MGKKYEVPEIEIIELNNNDIVTSSGCTEYCSEYECERYGYQGGSGTGTCEKNSR